MNRIFGMSNVFLRNSIYKYLIENQDKYGMKEIKLGNNKSEKDWLYALTNAIVRDIDVSNKDVLAVLYKLEYEFEPTDGVRKIYQILKFKQELKNENLK